MQVWPDMGNRSASLALPAAGLLCAAIAILVLPAAFAQEPVRSLIQIDPDRGFASIQGFVLPAPGERYLPGRITVTLTSQKRDRVQVRTADPAGGFIFDSLGHGNYILKVDCLGRPSVEQSVIVAGSLRGEVVTVSIALPSAEGAAAENRRPPGGRVSAQLLSAPRKVLRELEKADQASRRDDHAAAVRHLQKAVELSPGLPEAHINLGVQYIHLQKWDAAAASFRRAIGLNPGDPLAHGNLGAVYLHEGVIMEALRSLKTAYDLDPYEFKTVCLLAESYRIVGDFLAASEHFLRASALRPGDPDVLLRAADSEIQVMLYADAAAILRKFVETFPDDGRAAGVRSLIARLQGR
jgi:Flp pilus assembly protein TadD